MNSIIKNNSIDFLLDGSGDLKSLNENAIDRINGRMKEIDRAISAFGRKNSQTTTKMMSLTMLSEGPYRRLRQCLAEIDRRRKALNEAFIQVRKTQIELKWNQKEIVSRSGDDSLDYELLEVARDELLIKLDEYRASVEGALKDIGCLQDAYDQIRESYGISEKWDESDFEEAEVRAHVMSAFRLAFYDYMERGTIGKAAMEYLSQFGIHPYSAKLMLADYMQELNNVQKGGSMPTIDHFYEWLNKVTFVMEKEHEKALKHIGLTDLVSGWCQFRENFN